MKRILCVIDLMQSSLRVLDVAAGMANANKAYLNIVYPYRLIDYDYTGDFAKFKANLEQEARVKFTGFKKQVSSMDNLSYEFQPEIGFTVDRINSFVEKNELDMIVIGQHQANTINEINTIALQHLITNSKIPFTLVPESALI